MVKILTPRLRAGAPLPYAAVAATALWLGVFIASKTWQPMLGARLLPLLGAVAVAALASWGESRLYNAARARRKKRGVNLDATPWALLVIVSGVVFLCDALLERAHYSGELLLVCAVGLVWFGSASLGSLLIVLLDAGVSALLRTFRSRVRALVITLLVLACSVTLWLAPRLFDMLNAVPGDLDVWWKSSTALTQIAGRMSTAPGVAQLTQGSSPGLLFVVLVTLLVGLPAVASATAKFAGLVMERIYPMISAFDAIAKGDRDFIL
jgi:hypothetical protein